MKRITVNLVSEIRFQQKLFLWNGAEDFPKNVEVHFVFKIDDEFSNGQFLFEISGIVVLERDLVGCDFGGIWVAYEGTDRLFGEPTQMSLAEGDGGGAKIRVPLLEEVSDPGGYVTANMLY